MDVRAEVGNQEGVAEGRAQHFKVILRKSFKTLLFMTMSVCLSACVSIFLIGCTNVFMEAEAREGCQVSSSVNLSIPFSQAPSLYLDLEA